MKQLIIKIIKRTPLYYPIRNFVTKRKQLSEFEEWQRNGKKDLPPHVVKQKALLHYANIYGLKVLVETGTFYGDMVDALKDNFDRIYSIELSKELYNRAKNRFKEEHHIELLHGDSGRELQGLMNSKINKPTLFWLDGHYSGGVTARGDKDTPIYEELHYILNGRDRGHVIIIDDARCFGKEPGYPTIGELEAFIKSKRDNVEFLVRDDSIRITPK